MDQDEAYVFCKSIIANIDEYQLSAKNRAEFARTGMYLMSDPVFAYALRDEVDAGEYTLAGKHIAGRLSGDDAKSPTEKHATTADMFNLHVAWNRAYVGDAMEIFLKVLAAQDGGFNSGVHYAKLMAIVQSSGTGKSRLMDELGKRYVAVTYTLRYGEQSGYPPGDLEVTKLLRDSVGPRDREGFEHATAIALLASSVEGVGKLLSVWRDASPRGQRSRQARTNEFALHLHDKMAPERVHPGGRWQGPGELAEEISTTRSITRKEFCGNVVTSARVIVKEFETDREWGLLFNTEARIDYDRMASHPLVQKHLLGPLKALSDALDPSGEHLALCFVFDEVSNLVVDGKNTAYVALRRVVRLLNSFPVWTFVLSTQSPLEQLSPASRADLSARVNEMRLQRIPPFYSFQLDLVAAQNLIKDRSHELSKPLSGYGLKDHILALGRPLWAGYISDPANKIKRFVEYKLLCGAKYDPDNRNHLFAILSARIALEPCMQREETVGLAATAVASHLRLLVGYNPDAGIFETTSQAEPVLAATAAELLMNEDDKTHSQGSLWFRTIAGLHFRLLSPGLIDKGRTGELVMRILLIMARDQLLKTTASGNVDFPYAQAFRIGGFLSALFVRANEILDSAARVKNPGPKVAEIFGNAHANFTHFACTNRPLSDIQFGELLHNLLYGHAALQLAPHQELWDILIPVYLGAPGDDFDPGLTSAILIQVKNRRAKSRLFITKSRYERFFPENRPGLIILVDLGAEASGINPMETFRSNIFGFTVNGSSSDDYKCVSPDMSWAFEKLLNITQPSSDDIQREISSYNVRYNRHTWADRFPGFANNTPGGGTGKRKAEASLEEDPSLEGDIEEDSSAGKKLAKRRRPPRKRRSRGSTR